MHEVLVNRLGGLSLPRKSVVRLTDRPDMTLDVYRGRKTTMQQQQRSNGSGSFNHLYVECQSDREHRTVVPCLAFERVAFVYIYEWNPSV